VPNDFIRRLIAAMVLVVELELHYPTPIAVFIIGHFSQSTFLQKYSIIA